tara:strand:- start:390 stop:743 length:354 start_codon:yes stop_codon:yes gene_type:complete
MKKSQLKKIIRESIKQLMTEQTPGCNPTMQWSPQNPNSTKNIGWWNNMMQGKIDNNIATKPYWANNGACWFLQKRIDWATNMRYYASQKSNVIWINQLDCKIESLSSGGYLANEYGC